MRAPCDHVVGFGLTLASVACVAACGGGPSQGATGASADAAPSATGSGPPPVPTPIEEGVAHQSAPAQVILASQWDGTTPFSTVSGWGDFGVGGFDGFRGEIVIDHDAYVVESGGVPRIPAPTEKAVYVVTAKMTPSLSGTIGATTSCQALRDTVLPGLLPSVDGIYAIRVHGSFSFAQARSFVGWSPPYPNALILAAEGQVVFDLHGATGSVVAFYLPPAADGFCRLGAGCAQVGFHFHYLNDDRAAGGHLLDCTIDAASIEITVLQELRLHAPDGTTESLMAR